jgi:hypothetical protein
MNKIIVQLPANRDYTGWIEIQNANGKRIAGRFAVCGRADEEAAHSGQNPGRNPLLPFGDMPLGEYKIAKILPTGPGTPYGGEEFGPAGIVLLLPANGNAALADANGRHGFFIQGGRASKNNKLRPTQDGSLRLSDRDQQKLIKALMKAGEISGYCAVAGSAKAGSKVAVGTESAASRSRRNWLARRLLASGVAIEMMVGWAMRHAAERAVIQATKATVTASVVSGTFLLSEDKVSAQSSGGGDYTQQTANATKWIDNNTAHDYTGSQGLCATDVSQAIRDGGINIPHIGGDGSAANMGPALLSVGFTVVPNNTSPQPGDVAVIQPCTDHPQGHAAMWDGAQWVSDYQQGSGPQPNLPYPNNTYRTEKTPYKIYRWPR